MLLKRGVSEIRTCNPYATQDPSLEKKNVKVTSGISEAVRDVDLILIMTDHLTFGKDLKPSELLKPISAKALIIDGRNILNIDGSGASAHNLIQEQAEGFQIFVKSTE